jgi:drug/metabolite transporter (DMT)-like permease
LQQAKKIKKKKTLNTLGWFGLFVGFTGVMLLVISGKEIGSIDIKGGLLLLTACILFASGSIFTKKYSIEGSIVSQLAIQMLAGGTGLLITGGILGEYSRVTINFTVVWTMIYLTIFGGIIGYGAYIYVLKHWSASKAGTYSYVNTVIAVILGALILKEPVNINIIFSIILILGGVIAVQISKVKEEVNKKENIDIDKIKKQR